MKTGEFIKVSILEMNWADKYEIKSENIGGGQGNCYIVENKDTKNTLFLKILKDNSSERKSRFFRETTLFKSLDVDGIPKIIDTNVENFISDEEELYYCAELVQGESLNKLVSKAEIKVEQIIDVFRQLLVILIKIHNQEIVHRDIKPENIIIRDGKLFLVDFGISVITNDSERITPVGQELGNRFIRLPEFSAGSANKRDIRSDLTLAAGIALYLIIKKYPRTLVNEYGQYPHQTDHAIKYISNLENPVIWNTIFDRAFQQDLSKRWSSANEILELLEHMNKMENDINSSLEKQLHLHAETLQTESLNQLKADLIDLNNEIKEELYSIISSKAKGFRTEEMGWVYNLGETENKNQVRVYPLGKKECVTVNIISKLLGEQIVGYTEINEELLEVCRIKTGDSLDENKITIMDNIITQKLLTELVKLL